MEGLSDIISSPYDRSAGDTPTGASTETSRVNDTMRWTYLLCAVGYLFLVVGVALPAASAHPWPSGKVNSQKAEIDENLTEELWSIHGTYRIQAYSLHRDEGGEVVSALGRYGYNTTELNRILHDIEAMGPELQQALDEKDRDALHAVNHSLRRAWKDFLKTFRRVIGAGFSE